MAEQWQQFGVLGLIVIALAGYILRLENKHAAKEKEWQKALKDAGDEQSKALKDAAELQAKSTKEAAQLQVSSTKEIISNQAVVIEKIVDKMDDRQDETNQIIQKHINILESIRFLLERQKQ